MTAFMRLLRSVANSGTLVLLTNTLTSASGSYGSATRIIAANPHTPFSAYNSALAARNGSLGPTFTFLTDFTICTTPAEAYFDKQHLESQNIQQGKKMVVVEVWRSRRTVRYFSPAGSTGLMFASRMRRDGLRSAYPYSSACGLDTSRGNA